VGRPTRQGAPAVSISAEAARQEWTGVLPRVSPHPISSGISFRSLPPPNYYELEKVCDHYLGKAQGVYETPASRYLFELAHEVKGLLGPLRHEEDRLRARVTHLEMLMRQWTEVESQLTAPSAAPGGVRPMRCLCWRRPGIWPGERGHLRNRRHCAVARGSPRQTAGHIRRGGGAKAPC